VSKLPRRSRTVALLLFVASIVVGAGFPETAGADWNSAPQVRKLDSRGGVEVTAQVLGSDDESPSHARSRAMSRARQAAVEFVGGVRIKTGSLSFDQVRGSDSSSLIQVLTSVRADALMIEERLVSSRTIPLESGGYRLTVVLRGHVLDRSQGGDSSFEAELKMPNTNLLEGEEVTLAVRANENARIYVIGITDDGATVLLPNDFRPDTRIRAGRWLEFPDEDLVERGVRLVAQVPSGKRTVHEALLVVALKGRRTLDSIKPRSGESFRQVEADGAGHLLADLLEPLLDIPLSEWTFDQIVYEVVAN
jgi:hypothetical protein